MSTAVVFLHLVNACRNLFESKNFVFYIFNLFYHEQSTMVTQQCVTSYLYLFFMNEEL